MKLNEALKPYVTGMRYHEGIPIVDVMLNEKWVTPESKFVGSSKGKNNPNYRMLYAITPDIDWDDILKYLMYVVEVNLEREVKFKLLQDKANELKDIFQHNDLRTLQNLRFVFEENVIEQEDEMVLSYDDEVYPDTMPFPESPIQTPQPKPVPKVVPKPEPKVVPKPVPKKVVNEHLTQDPPLKVLNNTKRGDRMSTERVKTEAELRQKTQGEPGYAQDVEGSFEKITLPDIELPPRQTKPNPNVPIAPEPYIAESTGGCKCGPNDMCPECASSKGF